MNPQLTENDKNLVTALGPLDALLLWQERLSEVLKVYDMPREEAIKAMVACLAVEGSEAMAHFLTSTKPWKPQTVDMAAVTEEMIDVLHFLLAFFNLVQMNGEDIVEAYRAKNLRNYQRIQEKMATL